MDSKQHQGYCTEKTLTQRPGVGNGHSEFGIGKEESARSYHNQIWTAHSGTAVATSERRRSGRDER